MNIIFWLLIGAAVVLAAEILFTLIEKAVGDE